ncbi:hypothetical protein BZA70DRAFT_165501 [Myxozyma melibiosi]|uniref:ATPase AAA-type core domain-containing protein n=1 Tax=Myxozyma melibiosi TaxID=54550 RepID=A0ABR1F6Z7_9ASCO
MSSGSDSGGGERPRRSEKLQQGIGMFIEGFGPAAVSSSPLTLQKKDTPSSRRKQRAIIPGDAFQATSKTQLPTTSPIFERSNAFDIVERQSEQHLDSSPQSEAVAERDSSNAFASADLRTAQSRSLIVKLPIRLTQDNENLIPSELSDDPVSSASEDGSDLDEVKVKSADSTQDRKRSKNENPNRPRKVQHKRRNITKSKADGEKPSLAEKKSRQANAGVSGNTLFKMWKREKADSEDDQGTKVVNSSDLTLSAEATLGEPDMAGRSIVKLKVDPRLLRRFQTNELEPASSSSSLDSTLLPCEPSTAKQIYTPPATDESVSPPTPPNSDEDSSKQVLSPIVANQPPSKKVENTKKPIYPFFMKKKKMDTQATTELESPGEQMCSESVPLSRSTSASTVIDLDRTPDTSDRPRKPAYPFFNSQSKSANLGSTPGSPSPASGFASFPTAKKRIPTGQLPAWPKFDNRHVKDAEELSKREYTASEVALNLTTRLPTRKGKNRQLQVPLDESILRNVDISLNLSADEALHVPTRHVVPFEDVLTLARKHVDFDSHPYLQYLYDKRLPHPTAFDRAQYEDQLWSSSYAPQRAEHVPVRDDSAVLLRKWLQTRILTTDRSKTLTISKMKKAEKEKSRQNDLEGFICYSDEEEGSFTQDLDPISSDDDDYSGFRNFDGNSSSIDNSSPANDKSVSDDTEEDTEVTYMIGGYQRRKKRRSRRTARDSGRKSKRCSRLRAREERPSRHSNVVILCGPPSSFKTAAVYAAAKELGIFVFEINAGQKRNGKDILDQVGEMSQSNLVHHKVSGDKDTRYENECAQRSTSSSSESASQPVFRQQSMLLIEDVDIVFESDKSFWSTLSKFIETSKRPVVLTCTDEQYLPPDLLEANPGSLIYFDHTNSEVLTDVAWSIALSEGHLLNKLDVRKVLEHTNFDFRRTLVTLQFWCQMAVGDQQKGMSWFLEHSSSDVASESNKRRVISENTFTKNHLELCFPNDGAEGVEGSDKMGIASEEQSTSKKSDLALLSAGYDLMSAVDIWKHHSHTLLEVPAFLESDEDSASSRPAVPDGEAMVGFPIVSHKLQNATAPIAFELEMIEPSRVLWKETLVRNGLGVHYYG